MCGTDDKNMVGINDVPDRKENEAAVEYSKNR